MKDSLRNNNNLRGSAVLHGPRVGVSDQTMKIPGSANVKISPMIPKKPLIAVSSDVS